MPKNQFPENKSTSCYLSTTASRYLAEICLLLKENRSQVINRLIIEEYARMNMTLKKPENNQDSPS